jgi:hypothetical protein
MRFRTTAMRQGVQAGTISMSAMSSGASGSCCVCCEYSTRVPRLGGVSELFVWMGRGLTRHIALQSCGTHLSRMQTSGLL